MSWGAFSRGFADHQQGLQRRRGEMAQAFNQFAQQNPGASLQEFQAFIDQASGGSNYVRGGAPSGEVLRSVVERRNAEAAQQRMMQNLRMLNERAQIMGQLQASAQQFVGNAEIGELPERYNQFTNMLFGGEVPEEFGFVSEFFNPEYVQQQRTLVAGQALPKVLEAISMLPDDQISEQNLTRLVPEFQGLPASMRASVIKQAQSQRAEQAQAQERERAAQILIASDRMREGWAARGVNAMIQAGDAEGAREIAKATYDEYSQQWDGQDNAPDFDSIWDEYVRATTAPMQAIQRRNRPILEAQITEARTAAEQAQAASYNEGLVEIAEEISAGNPLIAQAILRYGQEQFLDLKQLAQISDQVRQIFVDENGDGQIDGDEIPTDTQALSDLSRLLVENGISGGSMEDIRQVWAREAAVAHPDLPEPQTMRDFADSTMKSIASEFDKHEKEIESLATSTKPEEALVEIRRIRAEMESKLRYLRAYLNQASLAAHGENGWLLAGEVRDDNSFARLLNLAEGQYRRAEELAARTEERISRQAGSRSTLTSGGIFPGQLPPADARQWMAPDYTNSTILEELSDRGFRTPPQISRPSPPALPTLRPRQERAAPESREDLFIRQGSGYPR